MARWETLILLALLVGGCTGPSEPPPTSIVVLDHTRLTAVEVNLKQDAELAPCVIHVTAQNDTCVLSGTVPTEHAKQRAEELALRVEGIHKVANHLEIVPSP